MLAGDVRLGVADCHFHLLGLLVSHKGAGMIPSNCACA